MTGQRYIDEVLLPHVRLFRGAVGDKFVFMDDNATCHRTLAVQDCLDSEGIQRLVWPARSPDLNPIENVWDALGRQVAGRNYPPTNKNALIRALTEEWDKLPQQLLDNVVQSQFRVEPQRIILKSDLPVHLRPYRTSPIQGKEIKGQVEKLLQAGLIKESNSPYSAPVTLAFRRDEGKKSRLCIAFRMLFVLNALCKADSEPLHIMDSLLDKLARANFFSTLDLASGYWHVPIHPKDTEKLAFYTNFGLYEGCRLPFGIKVAPAILID
ncbi:retrovirus-related Pol polyprotein from transposon 17.6 [Trichonephila clavipes]|nr:retrovirus-related Pol polyprotein from transposon 17.6 [Trichonephila clavipes]